MSNPIVLKPPSVHNPSAAASTRVYFFSLRLDSHEAHCITTLLSISVFHYSSRCTRPLESAPTLDGRTLGIAPVLASNAQKQLVRAHCFPPHARLCRTAQTIRHRECFRKPSRPTTSVPSRSNEHPRCSTTTFSPRWPTSQRDSAPLRSLPAASSVVSQSRQFRRGCRRSPTVLKSSRRQPRRNSREVLALAETNIQRSYTWTRPTRLFTMSRRTIRLHLCHPWLACRRPSTLSQGSVHLHFFVTQSLRPHLPT